VKPYYEDDSVTIYHGDCREILPDLKADAIITDPPYGISFESRAARGATPGAMRGSGGQYGRDWGPIIGDDEPFEPAHLLNFPKVILWGAHCYASRLPDSTGWLVWDKKRGGTVSTKFNSSSSDMAWTNWLGHVKTFSHLWDGLRRDSEIGIHLHPTQKPVPLMRWCIDIAGAQTVIDPYMGSGPTLRAAKDLNRKAVGIELDERYCEIAADRCSQEVLDLAA